MDGISEGKKTETSSDAPVIVAPNQDQNEAWEHLKERNESLNNQVSKLEKRVKTFEEKIEGSNIKTIETLGIFVALFTFISVETQVMRSGISFLSAVGFSLIILGGLGLFLSILHWFVVSDKDGYNKKHKDYKSPSVLFICLFVIFIGLLTIKSENVVKVDLDERYYNKIEVNNIATSSAYTSIRDFKDCILRSQSYWPCLSD